MSRPRRFGKSLLISTLEAVFLGRRDLFENLDIAQTDYFFLVYPVIKMEFTRVNVRQVEDLESYIINTANSCANIPNNITLKDEKYYQSIFYAVITLIGFDIEAEVNTNQGRIDCVLQTADTIYIIEFKLNDTKEAAMQQIKDKKNPQKYQSRGKEIVLLGVEFDQHKRNIGGYLRG